MTAGTVDFFVPGPPTAPTGRAPRLALVYTLAVTSAHGTPYVLHGVKGLTGGSPCRLWPETTTLDVRVVATGRTTTGASSPDERTPVERTLAERTPDEQIAYGQVVRGQVVPEQVTHRQVTGPDRVVAEGELRIGPAAFLRQLTTFRGTGQGAGRAAGAFALDFAGRLARLYADPRPSSRGRSTGPPVPSDPLLRPPSPEPPPCPHSRPSSPTYGGT
ncbi:hypothetical protein [Streptomyces sp. 8P21H-1]|uniref:hypothetical protein n=1 Tax=Streptomyces sp. 8P21H-1 TaxID=2737048 RepID=UPI0015709E1F|nr:hypothetical protein [Streptomyces sp. 8P21H-1]NSL42727.1 hypothetical protein [Streptomyces sp. 8P21H-1]